MKKEIESLIPHRYPFIFVDEILSANNDSVIGLKTFSKNVGSYTQVRIAGDFLSSRKAAQAERCTPKTTVAALDG